MLAPSLLIWVKGGLNLLSSSKYNLVWDIQIILTLQDINWCHSTLVQQGTNLLVLLEGEDASINNDLDGEEAASFHWYA